MEWINVKTRLPEGGHNVLFCTHDGLVNEGNKEENGWIGYRWSVKYNDNEVTHWMPLPKPPKYIMKDGD